MPVEKKIIHLTLKKKWFDLTAAGKKHREYRQIKRYWVDRLLHKEFQMEASYIDEFIREIKKPVGNPYALMASYGFSVKEYDEIFYRNGYGLGTAACLIDWGGLSFSDLAFDEPKNGEELEPREFAIMNSTILETRNWENPFK